MSFLKKHTVDIEVPRQVTRADSRKYCAVFSYRELLGLVWQSCVTCEWFKVEILQTTNIEEAICSAITQPCQ